MQCPPFHPDPLHPRSSPLSLVEHHERVETVSLASRSCCGAGSDGVVVVQLPDSVATNSRADVVAGRDAALVLYNRQQLVFDPGLFFAIWIAFSVELAQIEIGGDFDLSMVDALSAIPVLDPVDLDAQYLWEADELQVLAVADDFVAGITLVVGELLGGQVALNVAVERGAFLEREVEDVLESWV